jgi:hypothetical protein
MDETQNNVSVERSGSVGSLVAVIVILAVIVLGAVYFWNHRASNAVGTDDNLEAITTQSSADDTASIEADLNSTDVDNLDAEMNAS